MLHFLFMSHLHQGATKFFILSSPISFINVRHGRSQNRNESRMPIRCLFPWQTSLTLVQKCDDHVLLSLCWAALDWTALGLHTGSCLAEYGQSKTQPGELFTRVPNSPDTGRWAGMPLAFICDDFTFYDVSLKCHPYQECLRESSLPTHVCIRFCFDKSKNNFTIRKFK